MTVLGGGLRVDECFKVWISSQGSLHENDVTFVVAAPKCHCYTTDDETHLHEQLPIELSDRVSVPRTRSHDVARSTSSKAINVNQPEN